MLNKVKFWNFLVPEFFISWELCIFVVENKNNNF